jgi:DtxR family Mn-dependent transcriptional regulator
LGREKLKLSASLEDYLEAIHNLSAKTGAVRSKDIADNLGVARASVTGAVRLLKDKGLANYEPYGPVTLTPSGEKIASEVAAKHRILKAFFVDVLGVNRQDAQRAACRAEHALGGDIIGRLLSFVEFVDHSQANGRDLVKEFQQFCMKGTSKNSFRRSSESF